MSQRTAESVLEFLHAKKSVRSLCDKCAVMSVRKMCDECVTSV